MFLCSNLTTEENKSTNNFRKIRMVASIFFQKAHVKPITKTHLHVYSFEPLNPPSPFIQ